MRIASIPFNEELRLQDLYSYDILDSEQEKDFDDLLQIAAQIYGCPIAAISFIDRERQWFKSKIGLPNEAEGTSREVSFCAHTILDNEVLIVEDAASDQRFCNNPEVTSGLLIRFYAGAPIVSAGGYRLGSICVVDSQPRLLTREEAKVLRILSQQISKLLELRLKNKLMKERAEEQLKLEKLLLQKTLQEHEVEKKIISNELHENIAQALAATKFYLEMAEDGNGSVVAELLRKSKQTITRLVSQIRELSQSIAPSLLKEVELKELIEGKLSRFQNQYPMEIRLIYEGDLSVAPDLALTVYRIIETQLENVRQHAKASQVTIIVNVFALLHLSIKDNGIGFKTETFRKGIGLNKILTKVEAMNGRVEITSCVKGGCELTISLPR